jgi:tetratricopeptide (TPR) repeat protein
VNANAAWLLKTADPSDADSVYRATAIALKYGLEAQALPLARAGAANHPQDARMWQMVALACRRLEDLEPGLEAIERAAALAPEDALIAHTRARMALEAGLKSIHLFDLARRRAPDDSAIFFGWISACFAEQRLDLAIAALEEAIHASPTWVEAQNLLARLRWMGGEGATFTQGYERALSAAASGDVRLWRDLAHILIQAERYDEALAILGRGRAAAGEDKGFDADETVCHAEKGDIANADRAFAKLGPIEHVTMAVRYMRYLLRAGRPDQASAYADTWVGRDPAHLLTPYMSAAWRLTGDPRWAWLEGDPSFIGIYDIADDIPSLAALAERLRTLHLSVHHPLEQSLRGGTQTDGPLFSRIEPEIRELRAAVVSAVERHVASLPPYRVGHPLLVADRAPIRFAGSWSVRLTGAGFHVNHVHIFGWLSSAFYVALPEEGMGGPDQAGWLALGEATELGLDLPPIRLVEPKPGRLVLFPSTMWHGTRPFAAGERLTVAFDVARP